MTKFKLLGAVATLATLIATQSQASGIEGREVAAPRCSAACMTDHGPSVCGELIWVSGARAGHAGKKHASSPQVDAPHRNGRNKTPDDWPANMILG
jgi:hypothetical protein